MYIEIWEVRMINKLLKYAVRVIVIFIISVSSISVMTTNKVSAAQDCDANAVIYCGVTSTSDLKNKYRLNQGGNLQAIFQHFGIFNETYFNDMQIGRVTKSGEVYVGNKLVATRAITAGRQFMPGSTKIPGVEAYQRPPSVSFRSNSLPALVKMSQKKFKSAVILSCGNPVKAVPVVPSSPAPSPSPKPVPSSQPRLQIEKWVSEDNQENWQKQITVNPGAEMEYRIVVMNTGKVALQDIKIQDSLPTDVSFWDAPLRGSPGVEDYDISQLVGSGIVKKSLDPGASIEIMFSVIVGNQTDACVSPLKNIAFVSANRVPEENDFALTKVCQPSPPPLSKVEAVKPKSPTKALPSTGASSIMTIFSVASLAGMSLYSLKEFFIKFLR